MTLWEKPKGDTVEWYTPPEVFHRLRLRFNLDPAAPPLPGADWIPAEDRYSSEGEVKGWYGRVWLNPPYGPDLPKFIDRMVSHSHGIALTANRTETAWWQKAARSASLMCMIENRLHFIRNDGYQARASHGSTLFAWGYDCSKAVREAGFGLVVERK